MSQTTICAVKPLKNSKIESQSTISPDGIIQFIKTTKSAYNENTLIEGIYFRVYDGKGWLKSRAKVVRSDFICGNDHWSKGILTENRLSTCKMFCFF